MNPTAGGVASGGIPSTGIVVGELPPTLVITQYLLASDYKIQYGTNPVSFQVKFCRPNKISEKNTLEYRN